MLLLIILKRWVLNAAFLNNGGERKMMGCVGYRLSDITEFEGDSLRGGASQRASAGNDRRK